MGKKGGGGLTRGLGDLVVVGSLNLDRNTVESLPEGVLGCGGNHLEGQARPENEERVGDGVSLSAQEACFERRKRKDRPWP